MHRENNHQEYDKTRAVDQETYSRILNESCLDVGPSVPVARK